MRLPGMKYSDGNTKAVQMQFGGYNHTPGAGDGELWDMKNLTSDSCPLLSSRKPRGLVRTLAAPGGVGGHNALYWVDGTNFCYDGAVKGAVEAGEKLFAEMGSRILIWPDKKMYNAAADVFESLEASVSAGSVTFGNGTLYGEAAECNTVTAPGVDFSAHFSVGDAVEISGCTLHPENNKTPIVREISEDGHELRFYEYAFRTDGTDEAPADYTEPGPITFARTAPDMDWICVNENRLWGCKGDTIYASKLGDPKNFNVFDGVDTDSYWVDAGSAGNFTGCVSYLGYPCFFKERHIYKMYGDLPSNFQLIGSATLGVKEGCGRSLAVAGEVLFYLSTAGVMAYSGGIPSPAGENLGDSFQGAVAGSDGLKYYVSMQASAGAWHLFVYDSQRGVWHREDDAQAMGWASIGGTLYLLKADGGLWDVTGGSGAGEGAVEWMAEFADFTEGRPNAKGYSKLQLRLELEAGASARAELLFDSRGEWETVRTLRADGRRTYLLPIIPRRADHYRLRLSGKGGCVVYSLARQYYSGSENRTIRR